MKHDVKFGCLKIARKSLKVAGSVLSKRSINGCLVSLIRRFWQKKWCLRLGKIKLRFLGFIVLFTPLLTQASFFGNQWIEQNETGLKILGDNILLSGLLKEWCDVCHKQCVIDIDTKQKISLSIEQSSCDQVYQFLSQSVSVDVVNDVHWFQKEPKGLWVTYSCMYRQPSEIMAALKSLLSPMGKYDHVVSDDATSTLWLPKRFYDNHQALIEQMDKPVSQYSLHLSWLRVTNALINRHHIKDDDLWGWLNGQKRSISIPQLMGWLQRYQQQGEMTILSEIDILLRSGQALKAKLSELLPVERRDKKGSLYWKEALLGVEVDIKSTQLKDGSVLLNINLQDKNEVLVTQQADIAFQNSVAVFKDESIILSRFLKNKTYKRRECQSLLSQIPFIGRLFCHYRREYEKEKYLLVVSLV